MIRSARAVPGLTDAKGLLFLLTALLILSSCRASSRAKEHLELGNRYVERNQIAEAEGEYQQAIRIDADFADAYYRLGLLELQQEHPTADQPTFCELAPRAPPGCEASPGSPC